MARLMLFLMPVIVLLSACGDDTTPASSDSTTLTNIYRFFIDANSDLNYINAKSSTDTGIVQTSTPANFNIASANYWGAVSGGTANSTGVSNFHPKAHLFNNGTNIIKVSSVVADGTPTAIQVSSEADLATYCAGSNEVIPDYASPNNSIIMYKVLISGGNCSTGTTERRWTTLGAASTDAVTVGGYGIIKALYNSNGSLSKLLIDNSNVLNLVTPDQDAANLVAITMADGTTPAAISKVDVLSVDANNKMLIMVDDANIYSFDPTGTALSAPITATVSVDSMNFVRDSTHLYYSDLANIYRIAMDGSETSSTHIATAGNTVDSMALTPTRIVFQTAASATDVHSVLKTDVTASATIATLKDSSGTTNIVADQIAAVAGEWIYYNDKSGLFDVAGVVMADNTGAAEHDGSVTVATVTVEYGANWEIVSYSDSVSKNFDVDINHVILNEVTDISLTSGLEIHSFTSYSASNHSVAASLGAIENSNLTVQSILTALGPVQFAFLQIGATANIDLYAFDATATNSLSEAIAGTTSTNINAPDQEFIQGL